MATEATTDDSRATVDYSTQFDVLRDDTRQLLISLVDMAGVRHVHAIGCGPFDRLCIEIEGGAPIDQHSLPDSASITRVRMLTTVYHINIDVRGDD